MKNRYVRSLITRRASAKIEAAQSSLYNKLIRLDLTASGISNYNRRYLGDKIRNVKSILELYGRLLDLSLNPSHVALENFVFVDYGGGSGLLSFLAKEAGVGTVIYNDIYDVSCADVRILSDILELKLDHIVNGDVEILASYLWDNSLLVNAITSYDVLEHLYDVESHFRELASLNNQLRIVYASGANIKNPFYVYSVKKKHLEVEHADRVRKLGDKERDSLRSYYAMRKDMISAYAPDLISDENEKLAKISRGLMLQDIKRVIDEYRRSGSIIYRPRHPTNTCDPYTGNWCEQLIEFKWLEKILRNQGLSATILPGLYHGSGSIFKKNLKLFLNHLIRHFGKRAMFFAPYYVVYVDFSSESL